MAKVQNVRGQGSNAFKAPFTCKIGVGIAYSNSKSMRTPARSAPWPDNSMVATQEYTLLYKLGYR